MPPAPDEPAAAVRLVTYGAPRSLLFVTVKRDNPSWRDPYGHWWLEVGDRSYGWWPRAIPVGLRGLLEGTPGVLNGMGVLHHSGTWDRDPQHGWASAHSFHPVLTLPLSDSEVRARIRACAHDYAGGWSWSQRAGAARHSCHSFQDALMDSAGLQDGSSQLASRGSGCPFLYRPRTLWWWLQDRSADVRRHLDDLRPAAVALPAPHDLPLHEECR